MKYLFILILIFIKTSGLLAGEKPLYSWGYNIDGRVGDGTTINKSSPTKIGTDTTWLSISAGAYHSLAIKSDGSLWAWGSNFYSQIGDGTKIDRSVPTRIGLDNDWKFIAAGYYHSMAIKNDGSLWTWGDNKKGQIGDGTINEINVPTRIGSDNDWKYLAGGVSHSFGIKNDGSLWAWGFNEQGQLGDNTKNNKYSPVRIGSANNWLAVVGGFYHSIAIKTDGSLWTWGYNLNGQLGDNTTDEKIIPTRIGTGTNWKFISAGEYHGVAIKTDGTLWTWGINNKGQIGDGSSTQRNSPVQIGSDTDWQSIDAGGHFTLAIKNNGTLWAWGDNINNQLGDGSNTQKNSPNQIGTVNKWSIISAGLAHSLAIQEEKIPVVSTGTKTNFSTTSITITGSNVTSEGGANVTDRGVVWSTSPTATISNNKVATSPNPASGTGTFDVNITGLTAGTKYYARAYATSSIATSYGSEIIFYTYSIEATSHPSLSAVPGNTNINLSFDAATTVNADGYVVLRKLGNIAATTSGINDGTEVNQGSLPNGTILVTVITNNIQTSYNDIGLSPANSTFTYTLIPFNWDESHSETYNYLTSGTLATVSSTIGIPIVSTGTKTNFSTTSITITGSNVTSQGGANVTDRGIVWSINPTPTIANNKVATSPNPTSGTGTFDVNITGLTAGTKYYARAYATSSIATSYGNEINFYTYSTEATSHPSLSAVPGNTNINLSFDAATTVNADGYIVLRKLGNIAATTSGINDGTEVNQGSLPNGTTLVTVITNNIQTSYNDIGLSPANSTFTYTLIPFNWDESHSETYNYLTSGTLATVSSTIGIPIVSTGTKTNFDTTSITITGSNVTSEGGANVTDRGIVWSTSANPTITNNKTSTSPNPTSGTGTYDVNITGLTAGTKYYARAYATSSIATSYGSEITFYTAPNTQASNITWGSVTRTSITANWTNGSGANRLVLVKKGSPISNTPLTNETVYTANSILGTGSAVDGGSVVYHSTGNSVTVTGLTNNTLYYFRVFESVGSGSEVVFNQNTATTNPTSRNTNRKNGAEGGDVFDFDIQTISPNPANDYIKIDFTLPEDIALDMQVYDLQGNKMFGLDPNTKFASGHNQQTIDCSNFPAGTYFISMTNGSEAFYYSFVVER